MPTYKITNVAANKCLNIYGSNVTSLTNNQNVTLWEDSDTPEQKWVVDILDSGVFVQSAINTAFALNAYRSSTYNCDVHLLRGNQTDAAVNFIPSGDNYKIQLANYPTYYLTAAGTANGSNAYWAAATNANNQLWTMSVVADIGPHNHIYRQSGYLHILETAAENIRLLCQGNLVGSASLKTMRNSGYLGVNGGFWSVEEVEKEGTEGEKEKIRILLNVALQDGQHVGPGTHGLTNSTGRSVIGWDGTSLEQINGIRYLNQNDSSIPAKYKVEGTWMQGGIDLALGYSSWLSVFGKDGGENYTSGSAYRTAMVAHLSGAKAGKVELMVYAAAVTTANFRTAIQQYLGITDGASPSTTYAAIMLDGGGSSQMTAKNAFGTMVVIPSSQSRGLSQIVTLKDAT